MEERLARGVLSLKEEKAGLDSMVRELQQVRQPAVEAAVIAAL